MRAQHRAPRRRTRRYRAQRRAHCTRGTTCCALARHCACLHAPPPRTGARALRARTHTILRAPLLPRCLHAHGHGCRWAPAITTCVALHGYTIAYRTTTL